ncbi:hypothetical protein [Janthinobacterium sp. PAMC25594]|uniref:hypothetical protein n=1 Tax=Janthinobacterium sp. PAMC25594 TaxID=2861284 RepID=UPI001C626676|nr:hypothetical protein [Janthinobacterium sp. PAMC25594]QYG07848.1 hypothetical protein KY494_03270 [Janthinobacterium sp. PAMC25594]
MRNFSRPLTVLRGLALLATASVYTLAYAEINLGVLSECKDIASVVDELKKGALPAADECKLPQRNLEYTLMQRAGGKQSKLCLLKSTSVDLLSDFTCFRYSTPANGAMTCFRRARLKDITSYKQDYERKGATMVQDYLAAASQCKVSNGNSSVTPYVAFPKVLTFIAKFEFGFTTFIGNGRKTDSIIQHGYARTDASITSDIPDAIEYISFNISPTQKQSSVNEKKIGKWTIEIKKHDDYDKEINAELRKKHLRLLIQSIDYDLEKQSETDIPITKK